MVFPDDHSVSIEEVQLDSQDEPPETTGVRPAPPQEEDWDKEIQESSPYDPVDVAVVDPERRPLTAAPAPCEPLYIPAAHHAPPVPWVRQRAYVTRDQFVDAED